LLIGLAIDPEFIADNLGAIALAIVVLVSRAVAVVPVVSALERFAGIPPVGKRNEAILIWGGLRGGVALALPESLPQRETFIAMTGGVVLAKMAATGFMLAFTEALGMRWAWAIDPFEAFLFVLFAVMAVASVVLLVPYLRNLGSGGSKGSDFASDPTSSATGGPR